MNDRDRFLWISGSPSFKQFHRRLMHNLAKHVEIEFWEYYQTLDEASSIDKAVALLHQHIQSSDRAIHLIGHGIGGVIALTYARQYPQQIASLVLLSVAAQPAIVWQSYYYQQLRILPGDRNYILRTIAKDLFPNICASNIHYLVARLERDLLEAPTNHSLFHTHILPEGGIDLPLLIANDRTDPVILASATQGWQYYLKPTDRLLISTKGGHFFHYFDPESISQQINDFWQSLQLGSVNLQTIGAELN